MSVAPSQISSCASMPCVGHSASARVAPGDEAGAGVDVGLGGVEPAAVGAGDDVAVERARGVDPVPERLHAAAGVPAHQPVAGAARGGEQGAIRQHVHAVRARGYFQRVLHGECAARGEHADAVAAVFLLPGRGQAQRGTRLGIGHGGEAAEQGQRLAAVNRHQHPRIRC
jgi:hypothetical protein